MHKKVASTAWSQAFRKGRKMHVHKLNRKQRMTAHMTTWYSAGKILEHLNAHNKETHKETRKQWHNRLGCSSMNYYFFWEKKQNDWSTLNFWQTEECYGLDIHTELSIYSPVIIKCKLFTVLTLLGWYLHQIHNHTFYFS